MRSELIRNIQQDRKYQEIATDFSPPFSPKEMCDAEFLLRRDGVIFNIEGYYHPTSFVVGEVLYAPDINGDKQVFGQPYRKVTLYKGTYKPIPYSQRAKILGVIDPAFDQTGVNPFFAKFKQILPASDFIAHLPSVKGLERALKETSGESDRFRLDFENLMQLLSVSPDEVTLGLTGAPLLGNTEYFHDLDIVFRGTLDQNLLIAKTMRDLAIHEPQRRLFEGGKGWQIRFFNDNGTLMCTFFTYPHKEQAPLHDFFMEVIEDTITVEGTVCDDRHSMYTPTILGLKDAVVKKANSLVQRYTDLPLIIYHTASRGDCFSQDVVMAQGSLVEISEPGKISYPAVCVIDRNGLRNVTPPWEGYYADSQ